MDVAVDALLGVSRGIGHETENERRRLPVLDGATSAFGFGSPHSTVSELLTKPEIVAIISLHRKLNSA